MMSLIALLPIARGCGFGVWWLCFVFLCGRRRGKMGKSNKPPLFVSFFYYPSRVIYVLCFTVRVCELRQKRGKYNSNAVLHQCKL